MQIQMDFDCLNCTQVNGKCKAVIDDLVYYQSLRTKYFCSSGSKSSSNHS